MRTKTLCGLGRIVPDGYMERVHFVSVDQTRPPITLSMNHSLQPLLYLPVSRPISKIY